MWRETDLQGDAHVPLADDHLVEPFVPQEAPGKGRPARGRREEGHRRGAGELERRAVDLLHFRLEMRFRSVTFLLPMRVNVMYV